MAEARLRVRACGPLVTYQDGGRAGMLRFGVPASGPMDRLAHAAAHVALGNSADATAIEISLGGLELLCEAGEVSCSIAGGEFQVRHSGAATGSWCVRTLRAGDTLSIRPGRWGSWAYVAFCGEPMCGHWAGHSATHSASGLGGGSLTPGAEIVLRNARVVQEREGDRTAPALAGPRPLVRVVLGPQTDSFEAASVAAFLDAGFSVTPARDRMGMRLAGPALALKDALSIPSEPIVRGSIQVGGDGVASVLLADHQTTGGYPKIATVLSCDLDGLSQLRPGDGLRFQAVDPAEAIRLVRLEAPPRSRFLQEMAQSPGSLPSRLMAENLISGVVLA